MTSNPVSALPSRLCRPSTRASFTLIELVVVIAIIAVLASLLLPALSEARERGRRALCMSNQKQYSMGLFMWEDDNGKMPRFKASHSMSATLEGQPLDNAAPGSAVTSNYRGHQDYANYLLDYAGVNLKSYNNSHTYIPDWYKGSDVALCPSASYSPNNYLASSITESNYNKWYLYGGMRVFYIPTAMNFVWYYNSTYGWIESRRSDRCADPTKVSMVSEPFFYAGSSEAGINNHSNEGMNAVAMDGSARWYGLAETHGTTNNAAYGFSNRFSDPGQGTVRIPRGLGLVDISMRVYTADGTYTNHLPATPTYQSQREAIRKRIQQLGYGSWSGL